MPYLAYEFCTNCFFSVNKMCQEHKFMNVFVEIKTCWLCSSFFTYIMRKVYSVHTYIYQQFKTNTCLYFHGTSNVPAYQKISSEAMFKFLNISALTGASVFL